MSFHRNPLSMKLLRSDPFDQFPSPVVLLVATPEKSMLLPPESVNPQTMRLRMIWNKILLHRIHSFHRFRKSGKMMVEMMFLNIKMIPVPCLSASGAPGEKRCKEHVVKQGALPVRRIQIRIPRMIRLHRSALRKNDRKR